MGKMYEDMVGSPVSSISPSPTSPKDTLLVSSMDGKLRIFDRANGGVLQTLQGHKVGDMRSRAAWGYGEGLVLTGDEEGRLWAYSVLDVSSTRWRSSGLADARAQAKPLEASPKPIHKRGITWLEMKPNGKEMITAGNGECLELGKLGI